MSIDFDLHTHTVYSHGKGSILENAEAASSAGLSVLGIADHGPGHKGFGIKLSDVSSMRKDIEECRLRFPDLKVLLGVEANIINRSGALDITREQAGLFDFVIAGYHYGVFGEEPLRACLVHAGGFWHRIGGTQSRAAVLRNTGLVISAIEQNDVKIMSHPGEKAEFDIEAIARCCEKRGVLMEINDHHRCLTTEGIRTASRFGVSFILGSDAHIPENVGKVTHAMQRVKESGLELSRIVNYRSL